MRSRGIQQLAALVGAAMVVGCQSHPDRGAGTKSDLSPSGAVVVAEQSKPEPAPAVAVDWASLGDCRAQLRQLLQVVDKGPAPDPNDLPFAVVIRPTAGERSWLTPSPSYLRADLPMRVSKWRDGKVLTEPCLIEIGPAHDVDAEEQVVRTEKVRSAYETGTRSEHNSEYDVAKARVKQAERRAKDAESGVLEVDDPLLDLIGVLVGGVFTGLDEYGEEEELDRALAELAETPKKIDHPKYRAYHFERTTVRAGKTAVIPVALVDRRRERTWRVELRQRELREFHLLDGLDARDRHYEQHQDGSMTRAELDRWARRAPPIDLSTALIAILEPSPEPTSTTVASRPRDQPADASGAAERTTSPPGAGEPSATLRRVKGPRTASRDPSAHRAADYRPAAAQPKPFNTAATTRDEGDRLAAVVEVTAAEREGSGVYVDSHLVLTSYRLVQGAVVIDVSTADGETVPGLLADADPGRDLALVQVPRTGSPVGWHAGPRLPGSSLVEVIGRDRATRTARVEPDGSAIRVRIDGARPPGLSGAPVFLGANVIGMVTASGDAGGRTLRVVAADEIARFLESDPGAVAAH